MYPLETQGTGFVVRKLVKKLGRQDDGRVYYRAHLFDHDRKGWLLLRIPESLYDAAALWRGHGTDEFAYVWARGELTNMDDPVNNPRLDVSSIKILYRPENMPPGVASQASAMYENEYLLGDHSRQRTIHQDYSASDNGGSTKRRIESDSDQDQTVVLKKRRKGEAQSGSGAPPLSSNVLNNNLNGHTCNCCSDRTGRSNNDNNPSFVQVNIDNSVHNYFIHQETSLSSHQSLEGSDTSTASEEEDVNMY